MQAIAMSPVSTGNFRLKQGAARKNTAFFSSIHLPFLVDGVSMNQFCHMFSDLDILADRMVAARFSAVCESLYVRPR